MKRPFLAAVAALAALATLVPLASLSYAQPTLSASAAGRWVDGFVRLYNERDEAGLARFASERIGARMLAMLGGPGSAAREFVGLYSGMGPLEIAGVAYEDPAVLYLHGTLTGGWMAFHLSMEPRPSAKVARLAVVLDERPPDTPRAEPVADRELPAVVDDYLAALAAHDLFSGTVAIARGGEVVYAGAFGDATLAGDPVTLETGFALASLNKMFTALAVLQLVEAGEVSLDDAVADHLPEVPRQLVEGVTVRHLLTHGSGLGTFAFREIQPMRTVAEMLTSSFEGPAFPPGAGFRYSNAGYLLLGAIVERASGEDFYAYLDEHVFSPAGMTKTGAPDLQGERPDVATGFLRAAADGSRDDALALRVHRGSPAADFVSTAPDLLRYADALQGGRLLGEELLSEAMRPQRAVGVRSGSDLAYGYGMYVETRDGVTSVGHGGGAAGASTAFHLYPEEGWVVVVLSNYDVVGDVVSRRLREMLGLR